MNRLCEIEDSAAEWYEPQYYINNALFDLTFLEKCFKIIDLKYTGVDGSICKCHLQAKMPGTVIKSLLCNFDIRVHS